LDGKNRTHHLVAVEDSEELESTLARAADGVDAATLAAALVDEEVTREDADGYIADLIDSQILRPELDLLVTGRDPAEALAAQLRAQPQTASIGDRLHAAGVELATIDAAGPGIEPARYRDLAARLKELPAAIEMSHLFQVDMVKPAAQARLGGPVLEEILRSLDLMGRLAVTPEDDDLSRWRDAFVARYEEREIPLPEALDDEAGIGFPPGDGADAGGGPLLKALDLAAPHAGKVAWGEREKLLLEKLAEAEASGAREITLDSSDVEKLAPKDRPPLPDAFAVMASVAAVSEEALSRGDFRIAWQGTDGPSGARLLGRFCDADPELRRRVEEHLRAEEALDPEAVFAEVVHLPEGRLGNVLFRPVLREYEIPYLGRSGAPLDRQIPIGDLRVSVSDGRIVLRSERLGRRVVPRLTSAHNYRWRSVGSLYRFLGELQSQGRGANLGWDWGPLWSARYLPRVASGRLVLSLAQWTAGKKELERLGRARGAERFRTVQSWRTERGLPRWIVLADGDNRLPIDLENVLSVDTFVHLVKDRPEARVTEMFPGHEDLCATGPEGRFLHELVVPFVRTPSAAGAATSAPALQRVMSRLSAPLLRTFPPGSEWLYVKLYAGQSTADRLLTDVVGPLVSEQLESGAADRWFFVRYGDPDWHLRVRFHGGPEDLLRKVLPAVQAAAAPALADGRLWKVQLDTYEREVERYGGPEGIELAEQVFRVDSESVLEILELLEQGDEGDDERWRLALRGTDMLFEALGFNLEGRKGLLQQARGAAARNQASKRELGGRFRTESKALERLLDPANDGESPLSPGLEILKRRSELLAPVARNLESLEREKRLSKPLTEIALAFAHMHVNRVLRSSHRTQELVLNDFLARLYGGRAARARDPSTPVPRGKVGV
jgi:class I lanthipeptide synthase